MIASPQVQPAEEIQSEQKRAWRFRLAREVNLGDRIFRGLTATFAAGAVLTLVAMGFQMARASAHSVRQFGAGFVIGTEWDPVHDIFGALPFIYGTLVSSLLALLIAVPIALGVATYLAELAPGYVRRPLGFLVELLAAIPSVVYGLWGIFVVIPAIRPLADWLFARLGWIPFFGTPLSGPGILQREIVR